MASKYNAVIAQSGGPTAVINQTLAGCALALRESGEFRAVLGARHGVRGIRDDELVDLGSISAAKMQLIAATPSAALGSTRDKPDTEYCERIVEALVRRDVRLLFYIGGNDSADTCRIVNDSAARKGHELRCFHLPKTIDNDLEENDHTPGYGSAARWVALAFMSDNLDNRALPGIKIDVVMGRNAGFLTASSALGRRQENDGPHLIYLPERGFDPEQFVRDVDGVNRRLGRCLVAVSEGIKGRDGQPIMTQLATNRETDAHGNVALSGTGALGDALADLLRRDLGRDGSKIRVRADTFGYIQRSSFDVSPVDAAEARAVGAFGAKLGLEGAPSGSIVIRRDSPGPYRIRYETTAFERVAARTRTMPSRFMAADHAGVTEEFIAYATPLVGDLPHVEAL